MNDFCWETKGLHCDHGVNIGAPSQTGCAHFDLLFRIEQILDGFIRGAFSYRQRPYIGGHTTDPAKLRKIISHPLDFRHLICHRSHGVLDADG